MRVGLNPPKALVTACAAGIFALLLTVGCGGPTEVSEPFGRSTAQLYPILGDDLAPPPAALGKVHQSKPGQIACRDVEWVGSVHRHTPRSSSRSTTHPARVK